MKQDFSASGPNQKWAGDITYLRSDEGWLYLAVVIDLWSCAVIGWSMSSRMTAQLACDALKMALWRRKRPENVIIHTDRGGQYCSADYQALLKRHNLRGSMNTKGCCYDNACAESFFHSLKVECIHGEGFNSREIMRTTVFNYIECDYNRWRHHSGCGCLSSEQFENSSPPAAGELAILPCMHIPRPAKLLFQIDDGWSQLLAKHGNVVPEWTKLVIERLLACRIGVIGVRRYCCASAHCSHTKYVCHSCKSKGCSACGMKATEQ
jgi:transposase-like protein